MKRERCSASNSKQVDLRRPEPAVRFPDPGSSRAHPRAEGRRNRRATSTIWQFCRALGITPARPAEGALRADSRSSSRGRGSRAQLRRYAAILIALLAWMLAAPLHALAGAPGAGAAAGSPEPL